MSGRTAAVFYPSKMLMSYKDQLASLFIGVHVLSQGIYVVGFVWIMRNQDCPYRWVEHSDQITTPQWLVIH
jgi:hypothetical protein